MKLEDALPLPCVRRQTSCSPHPSTLRWFGRGRRRRRVDAPRSPSLRSHWWLPASASSRGCSTDPTGPPSRRNCSRARTASSCMAPAGPGGTSSAEVASLPDPSAGPYPAWNAFDQDTGRFLFTPDPAPGREATGEEDVRNIRVLAPGRDTPVADINCVQQCNWMASFGPGPEEVTVLVSPTD